MFVQQVPGTCTTTVALLTQDTHVPFDISGQGSWFSKSCSFNQILCSRGKLASAYSSQRHQGLMFDVCLESPRTISIHILFVAKRNVREKCGQAVLISGFLSTMGRYVFPRTLKTGHFIVHYTVPLVCVSIFYTDLHCTVDLVLVPGIMYESKKRVECTKCSVLRTRTLAWCFILDTSCQQNLTFTSKKQ
jgi:hypothetical protein